VRLNPTAPNMSGKVARIDAANESLLFHREDEWSRPEQVSSARRGALCAAYRVEPLGWAET